MKLKINSEQLEKTPICEIKINPQNANSHPPEQLSKIESSIEEYGFNSALVIDETGMLLSGEGRYLAAVNLGLEFVPTIRVENLTEEQKIAFGLADNRIQKDSVLDIEIVTKNLEIITDLNCDFDLQLTGFESFEIDTMLMDKTNTHEFEEPELANLIDEEPPLTVLGDKWIVGAHVIVCGDSRSEESFVSLMGEEKADQIISDLPYNVHINGHVCGLGKNKHDEFAVASGELDEKQFVEFLACVLCLMGKYSVAGSLHYLFMDWRHIWELLSAGKGIYSELKNIIAWVKGNAGMGTFYRSKHEFIAVYKYGTAKHINNFGLGQNGRYRTNVWNYPGMNSGTPTARHLMSLHPTVKPAAMLADAILDASNPGGIILDPFGGSGSTLIAAEHTNRHARLIEIEPKYVDVTIQRWQALTGQNAKHATSGKTFNELLDEKRLV